MKVEKGKIVEATEHELFCEWLRREFDDIMSFPEYIYYMKKSGVRVIEDK